MRLISASSQRKESVERNFLKRINKSEEVNNVMPPLSRWIPRCSRQVGIKIFLHLQVAVFFDLARRITILELFIYL
jgi:hypothetical protein